MWPGQDLWGAPVLLCSCMPPVTKNTDCSQADFRSDHNWALWPVSFCSRVLSLWHNSRRKEKHYDSWTEINLNVNHSHQHCDMYVQTGVCKFNKELKKIKSSLSHAPSIARHNIMSLIDFHVLLSWIHDKNFMIVVWRRGDGNGRLEGQMGTCVCMFKSKQDQENEKACEAVCVCACVWGKGAVMTSRWVREEPFCSLPPTLNLWIINLESASQSGLVAHYKALCTALSRKLSIKRHPLMCIKPSPGMRETAGWGWGRLWSTVLALGELLSTRQPWYDHIRTWALL